MKTVSPFLLSLAILALFTACNNKIALNQRAYSYSSLSWNYSDPVVRAGETIPFALPDGVGSFTTDANGVGVFDALNLQYTPPLNQTPLVNSITATDSNYGRGVNNVHILGFQHGAEINFPLSFGDQNFPTATATTANDDIFLSAIVNDSPGWERWAIFRSTDDGATFTKVDLYAPWEEGESYPFSMVAKNNDLYVCGYAWESGGTQRGQWIIRKTSDGGATWSNVDNYQDIGNPKNQCYDIAKSAAGYLYAAGSDNNGGLIRESLDDGATWTTIHTQAGATGEFYVLDVSPAGAVWAISDNGDVYKGTFAAGWTFSLMGNLGGGNLFGTYYMRGQLKILSETDALYSYTNGGNFVVKRTTDGGVTWTTPYASVGSGVGHGLIELANGDILAIGTDNSVIPETLLIVKSTDSGATWANALSDNRAGHRTGLQLIETNDASTIRAFGFYWGDPYQILNYDSTDGGVTWNDGADVRYKEWLYTYVMAFTMDGAGNYWSIAETSYIDGTNKSPWVVVKSADAGVSWTDTDVFTDPANDLSATCIGAGPTNEIYVAGDAGGGNVNVRKTSDSGTTWNLMDTNTIRCADMTVAINGDVFYVGANSSDIRKGATNGTVWSTLASTFPTGAGMVSWIPTDIKAFSDGSLWLAGNEGDGVATFNHVIARSVDGGTTWTEVLREVGRVQKQEMVRRTNGDVYALTVNGAKKTSDNGGSWTDVYDGSLGVAEDMAFDYSDQVYFLSNDKIIAQNQFDGTFFYTFDYTTFVPLDYTYIESLEECATISGICALAHNDVSVKGGVNELLPLVIP
jgi:hypothetical protein